MLCLELSIQIQVGTPLVGNTRTRFMASWVGTKTTLQHDTVHIT